MRVPRTGTVRLADDVWWTEMTICNVARRPLTRLLRWLQQPCSRFRSEAECPQVLQLVWSRGGELMQEYGSLLEAPAMSDIGLWAVARRGWHDLETDRLLVRAGVRRRRLPATCRPAGPLPYATCMACEERPRGGVPQASRGRGGHDRRRHACTSGARRGCILRQVARHLSARARGGGGLRQIGHEAALLDLHNLSGPSSNHPRGGEHELANPKDGDLVSEHRPSATLEPSEA